MKRGVSRNGRALSQKHAEISAIDGHGLFFTVKQVGCPRVARMIPETKVYLSIGGPTSRDGGSPFFEVALIVEQGRHRCLGMRLACHHDRQKGRQEELTDGFHGMWRGWSG